MGRYWLMWLFLNFYGLLGCSAPAAFYHQGLRALEGGDYPQAARALSLVVVEDPQHVGALTSLGIAHYRQGAFEGAIDALERAQALTPDEPRIRLYLGLAALKRGQADHAQQHLATFLERPHSRALQEQPVPVISVLDEATVSDAVREYLADSLDMAFQRAQQVEALRQEVRTLEESWRSRPAGWRYRSRKHRRARQAYQFRAGQGPVWRCGQGEGSLLPAEGRPVPFEESR